MKNSCFRILLPVVLVVIYHVGVVAALHAQDLPTPPPPPPPLVDYFPDKWDEYSSKDGKFRIRFPKKPRETVTKKGQFDVHTMEYNGLILGRVTYVDFKVPFDDPQKTKEMMQEVKADALKSLLEKGYRIVTEREVVVDGYQGLFVQMEMQAKLVIRTQWVVAGSRFYTITASSRKGKPNELEGKDDFQKVAMGFINSFHVLP